MITPLKTLLLKTKQKQFSWKNLTQKNSSTNNFLNNNPSTNNSTNAPNKTLSTPERTKISSGISMILIAGRTVVGNALQTSGSRTKYYGKTLQVFLRQTPGAQSAKIIPNYVGNKLRARLILQFDSVSESTARKNFR